MKNAKLLFAPLSLFIVFIFSHCTPNKDFVSPTDEILTHSNWRIDYFFDSQDLTSDYGGYQLLFSSTGAVAAQKSNEMIPGTWNISVDSDNAEILSINFNTADAGISKFNQQWKLTGKTTSTLQFVEAAQPGSSSLLRIRQQ